MNLGLFYDTETTGLPDYKAPSDKEHQPHIQALSAQLVDLDTQKVINSIDMIVRPQGWQSSPEAYAVHGIDHDYACRVGVAEETVVKAFLGLWQGHNRIGHNQPYDARIMRIAILRHVNEHVADGFKTSAAECTMQLARPHCKLEKNKAPKLSEAYEILCDKPMIGAHTALADVEACKEVYFAVRALNK